MSGVSKVKVFVERADNRPWKYVTLEIPNHILKDDNLLYEAIEARLIDTLQEPFGGWDIISTEEIKSFESTPYNNYYGRELFRRRSRQDGLAAVEIVDRVLDLFSDREGEVRRQSPGRGGPRE